METLSTTHRKIAKVLLLSVLGCIFCGALFFILAWSTFEVSGIERNSITFRIAAPDHLKSINLITECRKPEYQWKGRDGVGVPFSSVNFGSSASATEILEFYTSNFERQSCKIDTSESAPRTKKSLSMVCKNDNFLEAKITIEGNDSCKSVALSFLDNG